MSRFFCLYIPQWQAWAARRADPSLASEPFVIYAKDHVISLSPEAQLAGAQVGWTLHRLESLLPDVRARLANPAQEQAVWQDVLSSVYSLTPQIESIRPGLLMADCRAQELAGLVNELRAQGGIAVERATAELAAYSSRRGEIYEILPHVTRGFLNMSPVSLLAHAGVGEETLKRLKWFGLNTVGSLSDIREHELRGQFPEEWKLLSRFARANDTRRVPHYTLPPSVFSRLYFEEAARQPAEWEGALVQLAKDVVTELRGRESLKLEVRIETAETVLRAGRLLREPLSEARPLYKMAHGLVAQALVVNGQSEVGALEIHLGALSEPDPVQGDLFATRGQPKSVIGFDKVLRHLFSRFPGRIVRAEIVNPHAAIPEESYRFVPIHSAPMVPRGRGTRRPATPRRANTRRTMIGGAPQTKTSQPHTARAKRAGRLK